MLANPDAHPCDRKWAIRFEDAERKRDGMRRDDGAVGDRWPQWELPSEAIGRHGLWITTHHTARVPPVESAPAPAPEAEPAPAPNLYKDVDPESSLGAQIKGVEDLWADVEAEKQRRRASGDHESVARYEAAVVKVHEDSIIENRTPEQWREFNERLARNREAQANGATW